MTLMTIFLQRLPVLVLICLFSFPQAVVHAGILDSFAGIGEKLGMTSSGKTFLPPEKAFILSVDASNGRTLVAHWQIADGYYLYRRNFAFALPEGTASSSLSEAVFSRQGKIKDDPSFGRLEVFYHAVDVTIPVQRSPGGRLPLRLQIGYQGCADDGFCYPPVKKWVDVVLPSAAAANSTLTNTPENLPEQAQIVRSLQENSLLANMGMLFLAGILLAFTPCVLPMLPILSAIIVGQEKPVTSRRALALTSCYVLAMSLAYTGAGVIAGLFGANLQAAFQNPWILVSFSLFFVVLALSMFGFYELQMPSALQTRLNAISQRQASGSYFGAAVMGLLSALIVGPCVAAPLAGILIYIGLQGDAWVGGLSLFAMSLGMGLPLLVFGASAGKWMPRAGQWMHIIRPVFGVMLLGLSIWLLQRIIPDAVTLFLWAFLVIAVAVYMGGFDRLPEGISGWRKLWKAIAVVLLSWGIMLLIGVASGSRDILQPLAALSGSASKEDTTAALSFQRIKGLEGLASVVRAASERGAAVMVDFYADWCIDCKRMEANAFSDPRVHAALAGVQLVQADVTDNDARDQALLKQYQLFGPPAILFFDRQGNELSQQRLVGYFTAEEFMQQIRLAIGRAEPT